jgi:hypothetical protein
VHIRSRRVASLVVTGQASLRALIGVAGSGNTEPIPCRALRRGGASRLMSAMSGPSMSNNRAGHAAKIIVLRIRQNWRWSKAHSWTHLIEEHDLNPLVRGRRALRKSWWRLTQRDQKAAAPAPLFLVGVQRSGTNLLAHGLDELPEFQVYNEGNTRAFDNYRIRALPTIKALVEKGGAKFVLFKPLCDSHRTVEMLDYFGPPARAIWAYRSVDGRVRSAVAKFGDSNLRVLRAFAAGEVQKPWNIWQIEGLSAESAAFIRSFDFNSMSAESAAALFWYARNALYFELELNRRPDITLVNYDEFLSDPRRIAVGLCRFLDVPYRNAMIASIDPRRPSQRPPLPVDPRIHERCSALKERLDAACAAQMTQLTGERAAVRATSPRPTTVAAHP